MADSINLLRTKPGVSKLVLLTQGPVKTISVILLILTVCAGLGLGGVHVWLSRERTKLQESRSFIETSITSKTATEGLLASVRERVRVVGKIRASQRQWSSVLDAISTIAVPPKLVSVAVDEEQKVTVTLSVPTIAEAQQAVGALLSLYKERLVSAPYISSIRLDSNGAINMEFSFVPTFGSGTP